LYRFFFALEKLQEVSVYIEQHSRYTEFPVVVLAECKDRHQRFVGYRLDSLAGIDELIHDVAPYWKMRLI
jgi:hypothetical protein